jgi:hypothetical protein
MGSKLCRRAYIARTGFPFIIAFTAMVSNTRGNLWLRTARAIRARSLPL